MANRLVPLTCSMRSWMLVVLLLGLACSKKADPEPVPATPVVVKAGPLRVGVTLHPYYSWTANVIAGVPGAEVVPVLPGEIDAGNYQPSPDDITKLSQL